MDFSNKMKSQGIANIIIHDSFQISFEIKLVYIKCFLAHLYKSTGRAIAVTLASVSTLVSFRLKLFSC